MGGFLDQLHSRSTWYDPKRHLFHQVIKSWSQRLQKSKKNPKKKWDNRDALWKARPSIEKLLPS
jgi:hypothetical protein